MTEDYIWKGKNIGKINMFGEFVVFDKDVFRNWNTIGFETDILEALKSRGIELIKAQVRHKDGSEEWFKASIDEFLQSKRILRYKNQEQRHLTLTFMRSKYD